jgi:hypothetical protein
MLPSATGDMRRQAEVFLDLIDSGDLRFTAMGRLTHRRAIVVISLVAQSGMPASILR